MSSGNFSILTLTVVASAARASNRFLTQAGAYPTAGGNAFGVSRTSAAQSGDLVPVDILGTALVETGDAVTKDGIGMADSTGRVVPVTVGSKYPLCKIMESAGAAGAFVEVLLIPNAGVTTAAS